MAVRTRKGFLQFCNVTGPATRDTLCWFQYRADQWSWTRLGGLIGKFATYSEKDIWRRGQDYLKTYFQAELDVGKDTLFHVEDFRGCIWCIRDDGSLVCSYPTPNLCPNDLRFES